MSFTDEPDDRNNHYHQHGSSGVNHDITEHTGPSGDEELMYLVTCCIEEGY